MLGAADELGGRSFIQLSIYRELTTDQARPWVLGPRGIIQNRRCLA